MILALLVFMLCAWVFYQYVSIANEAERQVEKDIAWIVLGFHDASVLGEQVMSKKKHLETKLFQQSIDSNHRFLRHYYSLFIEKGDKTCLQTVVSYRNQQPQIDKQNWLADTELCSH